MLDGEIPKAPSSPPPTGAASPQNLPACFFWDGCASWRATKREGVQNTLGLRRYRLLSPSYHKPAQLQFHLHHLEKWPEPWSYSLWWLWQGSVWVSLCLSSSPAVLGLHGDGWIARNFPGKPRFLCLRILCTIPRGEGVSWVWSWGWVGMKIKHHHQGVKGSGSPPASAPVPPHIETVSCFKAWYKDIISFK